MKTAVIIPARYASTRFPAKPLVEIQGKSMIEHVFRRAKKATGIDTVIVATDDERIEKHVKEFGGEVMMTSAAHLSGTDRCAEVAEKLGDEFQWVINVQGDEPMIAPALISSLNEKLKTDDQHKIVTAFQFLSHPSEANDSNVVKLVSDQKGKCLYFSRAVIPHIKNEDVNFKYKKHIGIYAFQRGTLISLSSLKPSSLELSESLEQLRWLEAGHSIYCIESEYPCLSVDRPEDLKQFLAYEL